MPRALLAAALALTWFAVATPCAAQPSAADKATARSLMAQGDERMDAKDYAGALKAYQAADAIMHLPMTGIAVAQAQAAAGLLVEALDTAIQVTHLPVSPGETPHYARARAEASALMASLEPRISSLRTTVIGAPAEAVVSVDGAALPAGTLGLPRKVNPGKHVITAAAPGYEMARTEVTVREGQELPVTLALERSSATPNHASPEAPAAPREVPAPAPRRGVAPLIYAGFGTGGAALIVGSVTGVLSLVRTASLKDDCKGGVCPPSLHDDRAAALTLARVSDVSFAIAAAGAAVGIVGVVLPRPKDSAARIEPFIGAGSIGIRGEF